MRQKGFIHLTIILLLVLGFSLILAGISPFHAQAGKKPKATPTPTPQTQVLTTWTEDWTNSNYLERWDKVSDGCFSVNAGMMEMNNCESAGITSKQKWDKNYEIVVEGTVSAENSVLDQYGIKHYWGGLTLFDEHKNAQGQDDSRYGELAVVYNVPPASGGQDSIITLTNELGSYFSIVKPATAGQTYKFKIHYKKDGKPSNKYSGYKYFYYVDDNPKAVYAVPSTMIDNPNIFILCVATGAGGVTPARASCKFGPIKVTGVPVSQ